MKDGNDGTFLFIRDSKKEVPQSGSKKKKKKFPRRTVKSNNIKVIEMMIMK